MGGYGTYKLGMQWPDLFGAAFTTVGPAASAPAGHLGHEPADRERPLGAVPELGRPHRRARADRGACARSRQRFDELGLRSQLWTYPGGHFDLAAGDEWEGARAFLAASVVQRDPPRVDYAFVPAADRPGLGLVHDHAYWVSHLRVRDAARRTPGAARSAPAASRSDAQPTPSRSA